jgi:hypothetical protein
MDRLDWPNLILMLPDSILRPWLRDSRRVRALAALPAAKLLLFRRLTGSSGMIRKLTFRQGPQ